MNDIDQALAWAEATRKAWPGISSDRHLLALLVAYRAQAARIAQLDAETERLKSLAQGPGTNWAKVKDAVVRADAAENCSLRWMQERDQAVERAANYEMDKHKAEQERDLFRQVLQDQHYYESDCGACTDNLKSARQVL